MVKQQFSGFAVTQTSSSDFIIYTDLLDEKNYALTDEIIKYRASQNLRTKNWGACLIDLCLNKEELLKNNSFDLTYSYQSGTYAIYDVDYTLTLTSNITSLKEAIALFKEHHSHAKIQ